MLGDSSKAQEVFHTTLREAALLGKSWGLTRDWIIRGITQTVQYFTGLRGMNAAYDAVDDILSTWE